MILVKYLDEALRGYKQTSTTPKKQEALSELRQLVADLKKVRSFSNMDEFSDQYLNLLNALGKLIRFSQPKSRGRNVFMGAFIKYLNHLAGFVKKVVIPYKTMNLSMKFKLFVNETERFRYESSANEVAELWNMFFIKKNQAHFLYVFYQSSDLVSFHSNDLFGQNLTLLTVELKKIGGSVHEALEALMKELLDTPLSELKKESDFKKLPENLHCSYQRYSQDHCEDSGGGIEASWILKKAEIEKAVLQLKINPIWKELLDTEKTFFNIDLTLLAKAIDDDAPDELSKLKSLLRGDSGSITCPQAKEEGVFLEDKFFSNTIFELLVEFLELKEISPLLQEKRSTAKPEEIKALFSSPEMKQYLLALADLQIHCEEKYREKYKECSEMLEDFSYFKDLLDEIVIRPVQRLTRLKLMIGGMAEKEYEPGALSETDAFLADFLDKVNSNNKENHAAHDGVKNTCTETALVDPSSPLLFRFKRSSGDPSASQVVGSDSILKGTKQ